MSEARLGWASAALPSVQAGDVYGEKENKYSSKMPSVNPGTVTSCAEVARSPILLLFRKPVAVLKLACSCGWKRPGQTGCGLPSLQAGNSWGRVRTSTDGAGWCCPGPQLPHRAGATLALPASARTANLCATLGSREAQAPREVLPSAWLRTHRSCTTPVPGHPTGLGWSLGGLGESDSATAAALPVPRAQELQH